jgi:eukaryotic-like serine/threonine-protein kinase
MVGHTIAHYEILEKVGEGGMGVVYKARDTHLERLVAIKVLPRDRVADPERKRRFIQEARAASALNHPNIITVHDIACDTGVDFMVMEFVAGKTLDQLIGRKGLRLNDALKYGAQIAAALATAHAAGIIHRDLKPGNVMVTEGGLVKVLDFGLAKLVEPDPTDVAATETLKPRTEEGAIVGTAAYMSPEQAQGKKLDARSDIFSFGSVLYEMVTGRRAFQRETKLATLAAIVEKEPAPVSALVEQTPFELEKLVARCLRKDLDRRAQNMADVKLVLEELKEDSESGKLRAAAPAARPRVSALVVLALAVVLLAAAGIAWWLARSRSTEIAPTLTLTRLTSDSGLTTDPALSPDGKLLAYASDRSAEGHLDIYVQQVGGGAPLRLTQGAGDKREPAFSPDGTTIVYSGEQEAKGLYVISTLGGSARKLAPEGQGARFSPDGKLIAYWVGYVEGAGLNIRGNARIFVIPSAGGEPRQIRPDFAAAAQPSWSPDGEHLLFLGNPENGTRPEESIDWWVTPLTPGPAVKTGALDATRSAKLAGDIPVFPWVLTGPAWEPDGSGVVFSARAGDSTNLWRIGLSPRTWKVTGPPERLTSGLTREDLPSAVPGPAGTVRVAFASLTQNRSIWSLRVQPNEGKAVGQPQRLTHEDADDFWPALSPDGSKMVYVSSRTGSQEVWFRDMGTAQEHVLTASQQGKYKPRFSPDGSRVSYSETRSWNVYIVPSAGGAPEMVCEGCGEATDWSSDGKWILGNTVDGRAWILDPSSRHRTDLFATHDWIWTETFSPDHRWFSFADGTVMRPYIAPVRDAAVPENMWIDDIGGEVETWSPDGNLAYIISGRDGHPCLWARRLDPTTKHPVGELFAVFHSHDVRLSLANQTEFWVVLGGNSLVFSMGERTGNIWMAEFKP